MSPVTCSTQDKLGNDMFSIHKLVGDNNTGGISVSSFVLQISLQQNKMMDDQTRSQFSSGFMKVIYFEI
jgi:hypothetical protein